MGDQTEGSGARFQVSGAKKVSVREMSAFWKGDLRLMNGVFVGVWTELWFQWSAG